MFKQSFKYYKSKCPPPHLDQVLDFNNSQQLISEEKIEKLLLKGRLCNSTIGLKPVSTWEAFKINHKPGLIFIKNPFSNLGQRYWSVRCLQDYSKRPNKSNLDALKALPEEQNWWDFCQNNNNNFLLLNKLRWVTLGYHHNWNTKIYSEENKGDFPEDLKDLSSFIAKILGFSNFNAEAAIVNYYYMDSTLSGHIDHSESNLEAPLLSFSFGQTAIFLLGGPTKEDLATPIFLRSGDIIIMSSESRLCYHGVPKILQMDNRFWDELEVEDQDEDCNDNVLTICKEADLWKPFGDFLAKARINLNVRQVLKRGQKRLNLENT